MARLLERVPTSLLEAVLLGRSIHIPLSLLP